MIDTTNSIADSAPVNGVLQYFTSQNESLMERLQKLAAEARFVKAFSCIGNAWVLSRGVDVVPLVGARRRDRLTEALGALTLELSGDDLEHIERAVPPGSAAGGRYAAARLATLDSGTEQSGPVEP